MGQVNELLLLAELRQRVRELLGDALAKPSTLAQAERPGGAVRVQPRTPQRLDDVDVAEAREHSLVEERHLEGASTAEALAKGLSVGERRERVRSHTGVQRGLKRIQGAGHDAPKAARVGEPGPPLPDAEPEARVGRLCASLPSPGHAQVHDERAALEAEP